jgi:hypothetical protein
MSTLTVNGFDLAQALTRVLPMVSKDPNRPIMQTVLFEGDTQKQRLTLSCADGFVGAIATLIAKIEGPDFRRTVPAKAFVWINAKKLTSFPYAMVLNSEWMNGDSGFPHMENLLTTKEPLIDCPVTPVMIDTVKRMYEPFKREPGNLFWSVSRGGHVFEARHDAATSRSELLMPLAPTKGEPRWYCINHRMLVQVLTAAKFEPELRARLSESHEILYFVTEDRQCTWLLMPAHDNSKYQAKEPR